MISFLYVNHSKYNKNATTLLIGHSEEKLSAGWPNNRSRAFFDGFAGNFNDYSISNLKNN